MLDQTPETSTIFNFLERNPVKPVVLPQNEVYSKLGYKFITNENFADLFAKFKNVFDRTVIVKQDPKSMFGNKTIEDVSRKSLPMPSIEFLEKDGKKYLKLQITPDLVAIVDQESVKTKINLGLSIEGFNIENLLLKSVDGQVLDIMSLRAGKPVKNILTFSDVDSGSTKRRL